MLRTPHFSTCFGKIDNRWHWLLSQTNEQLGRVHLERAGIQQLMKYFHDVPHNGQGVSASSEHTTIIDNERTFSKRSQTQPNHMLIIDRFFKRCQSQPSHILLIGWFVISRLVVQALSKPAEPQTNMSRCGMLAKVNMCSLEHTRLDVFWLFLVVPYPAVLDIITHELR